jgi:ABC-type polysaccharide/polyol phosphate export permease
MTASLDHMRQTAFRSRLRLIRSFAMRDLKARFTATSLGLVWALVVPLATVLIYSTVFAVIFRAQAPPMGNGHPGVFAVWFFCGLVTWNIFAQSTQGSLISIVGMGPMLQKVYIPSYVPVASATLTIVLEKCLEAAVMLAFLLVYLNVGWTWLLYPLVVVCVGVLAASVGYVLAVAHVYFRDTGQIFSIVIQLLFFLTPVIYPVSLIPEEWNGIPMRALLSLNPMADLVGITRALLYELRLPPVFPVVYSLAWTVGMALLAWLVYRRWGRDVSEVV